MRNINDERICTYGAGACNAILGVELGGTSLLWCALVARGTVGSELGEDTGTFVYKVIEND